MARNQKILVNLSLNSSVTLDKVTFSSRFAFLIYKMRLHDLNQLFIEHSVYSRGLGDTEKCQLQIWGGNMGRLVEIGTPCCVKP